MPPVGSTISALARHFALEYILESELVLALVELLVVFVERVVRQVNKVVFIAL